MLDVKTASDVAVQKNFQMYCNIIKKGGRALFITNTDKPEVVMMSINDYERITKSPNDHSNSKKMQAYLAMEKMKQNSPFPQNYDCASIIEETFNEKYGYID